MSRPLPPLRDPPPPARSWIREAVGDFGILLTAAIIGLILGGIETASHVGPPTGTANRSAP